MPDKTRNAHGRGFFETARNQSHALKGRGLAVCSSESAFYEKKNENLNEKKQLKMNFNFSTFSKKL